MIARPDLVHWTAPLANQARIRTASISGRALYRHLVVREIPRTLRRRWIARQQGTRRVRYEALGRRYRKLHPRREGRSEEPATADRVLRKSQTPPGNETVTCSPSTITSGWPRRRSRMAPGNGSSGGAADEITVRWNREAFDHLRLRPRYLVDVSNIDTRLRLFGHELPFPILLAPGERRALSIPMAISNRLAAPVRLEPSSPSAAALPSRGGSRQSRYRSGLVSALRTARSRLHQGLVERAESAGCRALCVTVDSPNFRREESGRSRERRIARTCASKLKGQGLSGPFLTWKDIDWLRSFARTPVLLKGILDPDDAAEAVRAGARASSFPTMAAAISIQRRPSVEALPHVVERVDRRIPVLLDGGIRRGTDVLKALALGADAVMIGRPYLWGLAVDGSAGVAQVVEILRKELELAMALCGRRILAGLDGSVLWKTLG